MAAKLELQSGYTWARCLCREIDPADVPCIVCEIWMKYPKQKPPPEVGALFGKLPKKSGG